MTAIYRGSSDIMQWCGGVTRPAISNWIKRHPDEVAEPDGIIVNEGITSVTRGWLAERRPERVVGGVHVVDGAFNAHGSSRRRS